VGRTGTSKKEETWKMRRKGTIQQRGGQKQQDHFGEKGGIAKEGVVGKDWGVNSKMGALRGGTGGKGCCVGTFMRLH